MLTDYAGYLLFLFPLFFYLFPVFLSVQFSGCNPVYPFVVGANGGEGPPVPIPNTEVKLAYADNTWLETAREDRSAPTQTASPAMVGRFSRV